MTVAHRELVWAIRQAAVAWSPQFTRLRGDHYLALCHMLLRIAAHTWALCVALASNIRRAREVFRSPGIQDELRFRASSLACEVMT